MDSTEAFKRKISSYLDPWNDVQGKSITCPYCKKRVRLDSPDGEHDFQLNTFAGSFQNAFVTECAERKRVLEIMMGEDDTP